MPLNKILLRQEIRGLTDELFDNNTELSPEQCREKFSIDLSDAIDRFVKSGMVNVNVNTTGTSSAQSGTGTGNVT